MKHKLLTIAICLLAASIFGCCAPEEETINCHIYWQTYTQTKNTTLSDIESAYQKAFFSFYEKYNDNTVIARGTTSNNVRSITRQLCTMADKDITQPLDTNISQVEVRVFIQFPTYIEEAWSKIYQ